MPEKQRILQAMIETKIKNRNSAGEFTVQLFVDGIHQKEADYFTDDRKDAATTAADMLKREEDTQPETVGVVTEAYEVTGNGWQADLKIGEVGTRYRAYLWPPYPAGVKGSPLGRALSEINAINDLKHRIQEESGILLNLKKTN